MALLVSRRTVPSSAERRLPSEPKKILVAEDNTDAREMLVLLLEIKGYEVISAGDGVCAVEAALNRLPDIVLLDLRLPRLDGLGVTRELRLHPEFHGVPIVIMSGYDPARYRQSALDAGCTDYWEKPLNFDQLDHVLHEIMPPKVSCAHAH